MKRERRNVDSNISFAFHISIHFTNFYSFQGNMCNQIVLSLNLQAKPKKDGPMSLDEAVGDSENLTDFLLDFEEEEE